MVTQVVYVGAILIPIQFSRVCIYIHIIVYIGIYV